MKETEKPHVYDGHCPSCKDGQMRTTLFQNYQHKYRGYPCIVPKAWISVCDECDEQAFSPQEVKRWDTLFIEQLAEKHAFLTPSEITELRDSLGLNQKDFALLIGVTARSLREWERSDLPNPASRSADLVMKLLRASLKFGNVDVLSSALDEAEKWGVTIQTRRPGPQAEAAQA